MLNEKGKLKAKHLANQFNLLLTDIENTLSNGSPEVPDSRDLSICITKLEEACFFAKKAMAKQKENQD